MGGSIDIEQMGFQSIILDQDHDFLMTEIGSMELPNSEQGDFQCWHAKTMSNSLCAKSF